MTSMDQPNSLLVEYLHQLKASAEEKGNTTGSNIYKKCISREELFEERLSN